MTGVAASGNPVCQGFAGCARTVPEPVVSDPAADKAIARMPLARHHLLNVIIYAFLP